MPDTDEAVLQFCYEGSLPHFHNYKKIPYEEGIKCAHCNRPLGAVFGIWKCTHRERAGTDDCQGRYSCGDCKVKCSTSGERISLVDDD